MSHNFKCNQCDKITEKWKRNKENYVKKIIQNLNHNEFEPLI